MEACHSVIIGLITSDGVHGYLSTSVLSRVCKLSKDLARNVGSMSYQEL